MKENITTAAPATTTKTTQTPDPEGYTVTVNGKSFSVKMEGGNALINGKRYAVNVKDGLATTPTTASTNVGTAGGETIKAPMPGTIFKLRVEAGDSVTEGDELVVLEAMKMEVPVKAHLSGTVALVEISVGDVVSAGQTLLIIG